MALEVPVGGHISHANVSAAGIRGLKVHQHPFDEKSMTIDVDAMNKKILEIKPKIILSAVAYSFSLILLKRHMKLLKKLELKLCMMVLMF